MNMRIRSPRDFWSGCAFIAIAAGFIAAAWGYKYGTPQRMGPAYFPTVIAAILGGLGVVIVARSLVVNGPPIEAVGWRQLLLTLLSVAIFGIALTHLGLVAAIFALVIVGGLADPQYRFGESILLALFLAAFSVVVFVYVLGLPLQVWPERLQEIFAAMTRRG